MNDYHHYFDELPSRVGGSRSSGFIRLMLAKSPKDFDLDLINKPSLWLQQHYPLYGKEKEQEPQPKKESESPKMSPKLKSILEAMNKGRSLKADYFDGKTRNESGSAMYEKALKDYYDFMAEEHGVFEVADAQRMLFGFQQKLRESKGLTVQKEPPVQKEPEPKKAFKMGDMFMTLKDGKMATSKKDEPEPKKASKTADSEDGDWRAKAGYKDTVWSGNYPQSSGNRNSWLPKEYKPDDGWDWLASKYGKLYDEAVDKTKYIVDKGRPDWKSKKEYDQFIRLSFRSSDQMKEFFRDVLLADPIIYHYININSTKSKAPATTNALREFKKWVS